MIGAINSIRHAPISISAPHTYLQGAPAIAAFLCETLHSDVWTVRKVRHAREKGTLPIRQKEGIGLYAFGDELLAALTTPETLPHGWRTQIRAAP